MWPPHHKQSGGSWSATVTVKNDTMAGFHSAVESAPPENTALLLNISINCHPPSSLALTCPPPYVFCWAAIYKTHTHTHPPGLNDQCFHVAAAWRQADREASWRLPFSSSDQNRTTFSSSACSFVPLCIRKVIKETQNDLLFLFSSSVFFLTSSKEC